MSNIEIQITDLCPALVNASPEIRKNGPNEIDLDLKRESESTSICIASGVPKALGIEVDSDNDFYTAKKIKINVVCDGCKLLNGGFWTQIKVNNS